MAIVPAVADPKPYVVVVFMADDLGHKGDKASGIRPAGRVLDTRPLLFHHNPPGLRLPALPLVRYFATKPAEKHGLNDLQMSR